jgi:hypothetical protein
LIEFCGGAECIRVRQEPAERIELGWRGKLRAREYQSLEFSKHQETTRMPKKTPKSKSPDKLAKTKGVELKEGQLGQAKGGFANKVKLDGV